VLNLGPDVKNYGTGWNIANEVWPFSHIDNSLNQHYTCVYDVRENSESYKAQISQRVLGCPY